MAAARLKTLIDSKIDQIGSSQHSRCIRSPAALNSLGLNIYYTVYLVSSLFTLFPQELISCLKLHFDYILIP